MAESVKSQAHFVEMESGDKKKETWNQFEVAANGQMLHEFVDFIPQNPKLATAP